ncbi:MAG: WD40 repeat domain-containing protein, partial [Muribaculaceae bacterium]|nr:WD40 repeat domain-containing protein [Muribaculaceae bacterium]
LKEQVMQEAKKDNIISDRTQISVNSEVIPDYDANGNKILNYNVNFTYQVDPEFSAQEDFAPGKYRAEQSGAASSMLNIVKNAFEGDFANYVKSGKRLNIKISGTADSSPIRNTIAYDGAYGDIENEPIYQDNKMSAISVTQKDGIKSNEQLAFLRAYGVKEYLDSNVAGLKDMDTRYTYNIGVSEGKGAEFRRITVEFTFVDAF